MFNNEYLGSKNRKKSYFIIFGNMTMTWPPSSVISPRATFWSPIRTKGQVVHLELKIPVENPGFSAGISKQQFRVRLPVNASFFVSNYLFFFSFKNFLEQKNFPAPGIEPGPWRWERQILTTRPNGSLQLNLWKSLLEMKKKG